MHSFNFRNYQPMNMISRNNDGNELWLGDYGAATDLKLLKDKKIKHVLTAAAMLNIHYPKQAQINHKVINAFDMPSYKMTPHFQQAYQFISEGLRTGNVLVHCAAGISRSTTCVLVYLMKTKGLSFKQGLQLCRSKRPIVNPNYGFQAQLSRFETQLKKNIGNQKQKQLLKKQSSKEDNKQIVNDSKKQVTKKQMEQQKNAKYKPRFSSTMKDGNNSQIKGIDQLRSNNINPNKTMIGVRGKSTNFHYKLDNNKIGQHKLTQQFLTYKLQQPKIVTIKK